MPDYNYTVIYELDKDLTLQIVFIDTSLLAVKGIILSCSL